jgi:hypothetical protein
VATYPDRQFLGTRDNSQEDRPYTWRTYKNVDEITDALTAGNLPILKF